MNSPELIEKMKSTPQGKQSVYEHGESVRDHVTDLVEHLRQGTPLKYEWRLPDWILYPALIEKLFDLKTLQIYALFHDCGKPDCKEVDAEGKVHFPNHAEVSANVFANTFSNVLWVENLIRMDMIVHTMKAEDVPEFAKRPEAVSLLVTALAEVHANAELFGGVESTSFKIKWKQVNRRGAAIIKHLV